MEKDCDIIWRHFEIVRKRDESLGDFRIENRIRNWFREQEIRAEGVLGDGL